MFFYWDPRYIFFVLLPAMALMFFAQWWVKSAFAKASKVPNMQRLTGAQAARRILDSAGLSHIPIEPTQAMGYNRRMSATPSLDDHYDPSQKVLRLTPQVYGS